MKTGLDPVRESSPPRAVAVVGASGCLGGLVIAALQRDRRSVQRILALDAQPLPRAVHADGLVFEEMDVRSARLAEVLEEHQIDTVVHLACIVTPTRGMTRNTQYAIDVDGTHNVLEACVEKGVRQLVITSSGAAYGFHVDNPPRVDEGCPLRGNEELPYARHKRLVEELLAKYRTSHPELLQLVFRPAIVLGTTASKPVTSMFERSVLLNVSGNDARFVFVWDEDVAACIVKGIHERHGGIYNLAGDGALTMREIASITGAQCVPVSAALLKSALALMKRLRLTAAGPEQVTFLRYRPVLANAALKQDFGFIPTKTSREVFESYWAAHLRSGNGRS
jgi:UDP-glucose 4-epimerase